MDLFNYPLVSAFVAWAIAQIIKEIAHIIKFHKFSFSVLYASGGMPSSHSSSVTALALSIGMTEGFNSALFAVTVWFALVTMYDACGVRRACGEQAKVLNHMLDDSKKGLKDEFPKRLKEYIGHTPLQVYMGSLLGIVVALILYLIKI